MAVRHEHASRDHEVAARRPARSRAAAPAPTHPGRLAIRKVGREVVRVQVAAFAWACIAAVVEVSLVV